MSISLKKGQKISLTKENTELDEIIVGLGWDVKSKGFFQSIFGGQNIDCDASAILICDGEVVSKNDVVYFGNLKHSSESVVHSSDNLTGEGEGDDEQIFINLKKVPEKYDRVVIVVNIYQATNRKQNFGMIPNAFIRIVDKRNNREMCRYSLTDDYLDCKAMIFGEIYRYNDEWKFNPIGQGTTDDSLKEIIERLNKFGKVGL